MTEQLAVREDIGLLSDDRIVVRKIDGVFKAYGTPWAGEAGIAVNKNVPLSGMFFINHASDNRIKEITPGQAVKRLLPVTSISWYDREIMFEILTFCEECSVLFYDSETNEFEFFTAVGETGMELVKERFPADKGIAGRALRERKTQVVNDVQSDPDFYGNIDEEHDFKTKSILAAPLVSGEELVGVLNAINNLSGF